MRYLIVVFMLVVLAACGGPKDTPVPKDLDKIDTIKPSLDKLTDEERDLFAGYMIRHTIGAKMGALFGVKDAPAGIPDGMTIGKAIDEQRKFKTDQQLAEAQAEQLKRKVEAERAAKQAEFAKLVTVSVLSKRNSEGEYGRKFVYFDTAYENHSTKDILGIKGVMKITDIFGDKVLNIGWSYDKDLAASATASEKGLGVDINQFKDDDMKLWNTDTTKLKFAFEISKIVFKDGSVAEVPE